MGRRSRLIPNINSLLLQLHSLRTGSGSGSVDHKSSRCSRTGNDGIRKQKAQKRDANTTTTFTAGSSIDTDTDTDTDTTCINSTVTMCTTHDDDETNETTEPAEPTTQSRGVRFGNCEIRSYPQVLGDHPCCLEGCPIQLGWKYNVNTVVFMPITEYETTKSKLLLSTINYDDSMRLSPEERKSILFKQFSSLSSSSSLSISSCDSVSSLEDDSDSEHSSQYSSSISESTSVQSSLESSSSAVPVQSQLQQQSSSEQSPSSDWCERRDCERELRRECNKLNRDSRNSCRKRNRRNQQEFFGGR